MLDTPRMIPPDKARGWANHVAELGTEDITIGDIVDLAHTAAVLGEQLAALEHLLRTVIKAHALVQMDTPEDKALHAKAIETFWNGALALGVSDE